MLTRSLSRKFTDNFGLLGLLHVRWARRCEIYVDERYEDDGEACEHLLDTTLALGIDHASVKQKE